MQFNYDLILVGIGLSNGLIALRIRQKHPNLRLLLIESTSHICGNHIWSFHERDLTIKQKNWIAHLIVYHWKNYQVFFPEYTRRFTSDYYCITSHHLASVLYRYFKNNIWLNTTAIQLNSNSVFLEDGRILYAPAIIDGRGYQFTKTSQTGFQIFLGQEWKLSEPHHIEEPIIMDATVNQENGYRFFYILPISNIHLLIEDTYYVNHATLELEKLRLNIYQYALKHNWNLQCLLREEKGILPLPFSHYAILNKKLIPCCGLRAGLSHPTTGYSLPLAVALADRISKLKKINCKTLNTLINDFINEKWKNQRFFHILNRMLFLFCKENQRWKIIQHFYRLPEDIIARFYAGKITYVDQFRILTGKSIISFWEILKLIFSTRN